MNLDRKRAGGVWFAAGLLTSAASASAHDIVLVPAADGAVTVRYGHAKDWLPVDQEKLLELLLVGPDGKSADHRAQLKRRGLELVL